jgi:hypothetical protein
MAKIEISFTRDLTLSAIDGIALYHETVEMQLLAAKDAQRKQIHEMIRSMKLEGDEELAEWSIAMNEHRMNFDMLLPNFFRYSCIVLLYLVVENKLGEICQAAYSQKKTNPPPKSPKHSVIKQYDKYISERLGIVGLQWEHLYELNKVRNCIVHASGRVKGFYKEDDLRQLAMEGLGISISGQTEDYHDDLEPLYMEDDMLMIKSEYCQRTIRNIRTFFEVLCDAVSLPHFVLITKNDSS